MGFEPQLAAIVDAMDGGADVERQTLFFSATWPAGVRKLASKYARGAAGPPLVVSIGGALGDGDGSGLRANAAIGQSFFKLDDSEKDEQLAKLIDGMADSDRMICFTNTKRRVDYLAKSLWADGFGASAIHGGRSQAEREEALRKFKTNEWPLMFATDVAARGLDLPDVSVVVNFDMPRDVEQYVHRIGRTGRAGKSGRSVTFWNPAYDTECAGALAKIARDAGQPVPDWLDAVAAKGKAGKNWAV
ncbi:helicase [Aureococcus anophagefferens]|nr:helicase [Aureococcus anophagefferens]